MYFFLEVSNPPWFGYWFQNSQALLEVDLSHLWVPKCPRSEVKIFLAWRESNEITSSVLLCSQICVELLVASSYKSILIHPLKRWILLEGPSVMALWVMESGWTMESPHVAARIQRISATRTRTHHCSGQASGSTRRDHLTISSELFTAVADATVKPETVGGKFKGHKKTIGHLNSEVSWSFFTFSLTNVQSDWQASCTVR